MLGVPILMRSFMAIAVSCPSCDREMKVKDELAGKKIKCPGCGEAVAVLKKQDTAKARAAKTKRDEDVEDAEPEEEERPKKKKKPAPKGMSMLVKCLIAGGVAFVVFVGAVVLGIVFLGGKRDAMDGKDGVAQMQKIGARAQGAGRSIPVADISMRLKQIGLAYMSWFDSGNTAGPKNTAELGKFYNNDAEINELIKSNKITIVWGISKDAFKADLGQAIAWETQADRNGIRLVLEALGAPLEMNEAEFQAAKKAKSS
jgi:ribosomal protein S27E